MKDGYGMDHPRSGDWDGEGMRTYTVHLLARRRGEGRTFCGRKDSTVESLPEGDHLSPNERLCAACVRASTTNTASAPKPAEGDAK